MKKWFLATLLCVIGILAHAQNDLWEKANASLQSERYADAIEALSSLQSSGTHTAELYYNLGYAHLKIGDIGNSILSLERAKRISPNSGKVNELLSIANDEISLPVTKIPTFILTRVYDGTARLLPPNAWVILQLALIAAGLYLLYLFLFTQKDIRRGLLIGSVALIALVSILGYRSKYLASNQIEAIYTMATAGKIHEGADERSPEVTEISAGVKMIILDEIGEWYKVALEDRDIGWIQKDRVEVI